MRRSEAPPPDFRLTLNDEPLPLDTPDNSGRVVTASMVYEEARAARTRGMSTDEWYGQSRASRAMDVALDRAEIAVMRALEPRQNG